MLSGIILFCISGAQSSSAQGYGVSYSYSTTNIVRIDNATGALTFIYTFAPGTISSATALAVDLNGDIYFTDNQIAGARLLKFVPNPPPATGGTLSTVGTISATFSDVNNVARNLVFGKLAFTTSGSLFTISNYSATNANNLPGRPYMVNLNKATAAVVSTSVIPAPSSVTDLPVGGGDIDFSPAGRLFVSGTTTGNIPSIWEISPANGSILGYKSVPVIAPATYYNFAGIGFDLQGNVLTTAPISGSTATYVVRINAGEFSGTGAWSGNSSIPASSVTVLSGPFPLQYGDLGSNAFKIVGRVFEDVNYGGGAGRIFGTAGTAGIPNARVEVYNAIGVLENSTNTLTDGTYAVGVSGNGVFYVRVVNNTVKSTRPGSNGTELGVQTFRAERVAAATLNNVVDEVGGRAPATADPGTGTVGTTTLNTTTFVLSGGVSGAAQSVSQATIETSNVTGIDFGFNFSAIVNTNSTGQGSLQQFISNSNILTNTGLSQAANSIFTPAPGVETSIFMIPDGNAHPGINKPNQLTAAGGGATAIINLTTLLPAVTDANTSIDGRTQTANIGNTQPGVAGNPGTKVGVDQIPLPGVQRPEVEIRWNGAAGTATSGLNLSGNNEVVRGIAISRFGNNTSTGANILSTGNNNLITGNIIGGAAVSTNTEAAGSDPGSNISISGNAGNITNNYIIRADFDGIRQRAAINGLTISGNEILNNGNGAPASVQPSGIGIEMTSGTVSTDLQGLNITGNSVQSNLNEGLKVSMGAGATVTNNTFSGNGAAGTIATEKDNIQFNNTTNSVITKNIVTAGGASGIAIAGSATALGNKITQNSTYGNAGLGVDLRAAGSAPDIVTPNGSSTAGPNALLNFPVVTGAAVIGNNLVIKGYSPPGATIELFLADRDASFTPAPPLSPNPLPAAFTSLQGFGEGRRYLATFKEGGTVAGIADQDAATGTYMDDGTGTIGARTANRFQFTIPLPALNGVAQGSLLTATATDAGNNTSEFSGVTPVTEADLGDAPNSYSTLSASNGPTHLVNPRLKIGATVAGKPEALAVAAGADANVPNGDPNDDGLTASLPVLTAATTTYTLTFPVTNTTGTVANLEGWIDFNRNGTFDPGEATGTTVANNATSATLTWNNVNTLITGGGISGGITYARFRLTTDPLTATSTVGAAMDGEVEDYSLMIQPAYDLSITKTANPNPATAGQPLTYTLTVTNNGPSAMRAQDSITVTDNLPAGYTANSYTASAGTYTSGNSIWTGLALASGQSATITIAGAVAADATGSLNNTAIVTNPPTITDPNLSNDTARQTTTINRVIDYGLTKTASPKPVVVGQTLTYTITLTNNGPGSMLPGDTLTLTDNLPSGFTANNYTPSAGTYNSATGAWTGLSLATGGTATLTITGMVGNSYTGASLINTVTLTPPTGITDPTPPTAKDTTLVSRVMDLDLVKTATPKPAVAGQALTYTITLTNNGPAILLPADVVTVTDNVPAGFTASSYTPSAGSYTSGTGAWTGLTLATGQSATLTIAGTVNAGVNGTALINTATATPPPGATDPTPPTAKDTTLISHVADLAITKTDGSATYTPGTNAVYTIVVSNNGPSDVTGATVSDALPAGITTATWSTSTLNGATVPAPNGTGAINQLVNIPAGGSITYTLTLKVPAGFTGNLSNTATVTPPAGYTDNNTTNNTVTDTDTYSPQFNLKATKAGTPDAPAGTAISYTITYVNSGPSDAIGVILKDTIATQITDVTWTASVQGTATVSVTSGSGDINLTGNLPAGIGNTITITVNGIIKSSATGTILNTASVTPPGSTTPIPSNTVSTTVKNQTGVNIVKTGPASGTISAGDTIMYTIQVTNAGPSDAPNTNILDNIPAMLTGVSWTATATGTAGITGGSPLNGTGNINIVTSLPAGSGNGVTIVIRGKIPSATPAGTITNSASATPAGGTPVASQVTTNVTNNPALVITKNGPATLNAGDSITYTVEVINNGASDAAGAVITDNIPAQIQGASWTATATGAAAVTAGSTGTSGNVSVTANIPAGAGNKITIVVTGKADPAITGTFSNTATVTPAGKPSQPSNTVTTVVNRKTSLQLAKSGPATLSAGQNITYTLVLTNAGPSDATGVRITDALDSHILNPVISASSVSGKASIANATISNDTLSVTGNVAGGAGNSITIMVSGKIDPAFAGSIINIATAEQPDGPTVPSQPVTTVVVNTPDVTISKSGPSSVSGGNGITYTIVAGNNGPSDATGVAITDSIPAGISGVKWTVATSGNGTTSNAQSGSGNVNITGNIPAGAANKITITVTGTVDPAFSGSIVNKAAATLPGKPPVTTNITTNVTNDPNVQITKSGPLTLSAGQNITYTITVTNNGPSDAIGATITDAIPAGILNPTWNTVTAGTGTTVNTVNGAGNVNITGNIPAGAGNSITINVKGKVDPAYTGSALSNFSLITVPGKPTVSSDTVTTTITNDPVLHIVKTGPDKASAGTQITYQLLVTNTGPSNATGVAITDVLPVNLLYTSWTAVANGTGASVSASAGTGNINITGNIPAGAANNISITIHGTVDSSFSGTLNNTATAGVTGKAPVSASKSTDVTNDPNVVIVKSGPATISAGQPVVYTLDVTNSGPSNATNVTISDNLPAGLQQVSWTAAVTGAGTTVSAASGNGNIAVTGNIPAGVANKITFTINAVVDPAYTSASIANSATAAVPGKTPSVSTVTTEVNNITDLNIVKSGPQQVTAGQHVTYTIVVTNEGPANAVGCHIADIIPAGLQGVTWTAAAEGTGTAVSAATGTGNVDITASIPAGTGNKVTIVVDGKVDPAATVTTLKNTATATPPPGATDPTPATSTVTTSVDRKADLVIIKTGPADKAAGQPISYQLLITNNGPSDVPGAVIQDAIPAQVTNITFTATASGTAQVITTGLTGNNLTVTGNIPAGAGNSITVNINGVVNASAAPGAIYNTATVIPPAGITETVPGTNTSTINTNINTDAGLQISKSGPAEANVGDKIVYKVIVSNTGTSNITPVDIADLVPAEITDVTWTATATGNGGTTVSATSGSGNNINLQAAIEGTTDGPGEILITITGTISPAAGSSITNTATATSGSIKTSSFTTSVNKSADLNIIKTGPANINAGQQISYTFEVTNAGPADVTGASIADNIPANISNVNWNAAVSGGATVNTASGTGGTIGIIAGIPAGTGRVVVTVTGKVDAAFTGTLTNTATATPPAGVVDPTPAISTVATNVNSQTGLQVIKSGPASVAAGNQITYSITVINNGPSDAMNLSIDDAVPAAVQNVSWTATSAGGGAVLTGGAGNGSAVHVTGNLPAGTGNKIVISVTGTLSPSFTGTLVNTATATPNGGATVTGPPVNTNVVNQAAVQITKSGPTTVFAGAPVIYTIDIVNNGPSDAGNISITDAVPSQIQQVTWTAITTGTGTSVSQNSGTGNNISLTGNIPAGTGNKISITVTGIVASSSTGVITNTATATLPGGTPATSAVNTTISNKHGLSVVKNGPSGVIAGQAIVYTIVVTNAGPSDAINTNITDFVPAQVQKVTWTAAATGTNTTITGSNSGSGNDIQLQANIPAGAGNEITIIINGVVDPTFTGAITNTAAAVPPGGTPVNSTPVITQVTNHPELHITKAAPSAAQAGDAVTYVVTVTNAGPSEATGAVITDNVPAGINDVTWTAAASGNAAVTAGAAGSGMGVMVTGNIAAGAGNEIVVTIHGKLDPNFSGKVKNVAKVSAPGNPQVTTDTTVTDVQRKANVLIAKSGPAQLAAGGDITYTVDVTNNGPSDLDTLIVTDVVPSLITVKSWQAVRVAGNVIFTGPANGTGNNISIQAAATSGSQLRITITGTLQQTTATTVTNTAHIKVPSTVVTTTPDSNTVITKIVQQPGVTLQKTGPTIARTGDQVTYQITAGNSGPSDATAVVITDVVPAALKNVSWTTSVVGSGNVTAGNSGAGNNISVTANIGAGTGNRILITVTGTVPADYGGQLVNTATANVPGQPAVVTPPVITTVSEVTDLQITKTGPATLIQGSAIGYVVTITNAGPSGVSGATFSDAVPAGVTGVTAIVQSQSNGAAGTVVSASGNNVTGTIAVLPANGSVSILISGTAANIGALSNTATVTTPSGVTDKVPDNNTTPPVITTVVAKPQLHIIKTVTPGPYKPGDKITYTLTVSNGGAVTVKDVVVTDVLTGDNLPTPVFGKPGLGTVSYNAASHTATWSIDSLTGGQSTTLTYDLVLVGQGAISNTAIITGPPATSVPDTAKVDINAVRSADLVVNKAVVTPQPYVIAKRIGYKIEVSNHGPNTATGVVVTDVLPVALGVPVDIMVTKGEAHYDATSRSIIWTIGDVSTTDALTLTYTVQIISGGSILNTATIQGNENDPAPGSNTSVVTITAGDEIFIPNVITPNGDGKNDRFVILGLGKYPGSGLFIYNRWGNMVYQSKDYDNKWDGNGLNEGTYYYILKLRTPEGERVYKGWIELLR
ncbi:DUF7507 domain-containing protein [Chitinophaga qingshengii]|uniref:DUF11 domain-containing protein n=1 Tax=Chitinophaga qingshengii TaxID=1569794 RepID=A0ABR7TSV4_9BACT|nr:gliding motility-associated C-terminal domain-containing protein [Chitinophaga qingshengii]MBC9932683.1 DUF11 domain-containing protein [Chitinophaga qingshengii]